jgi:hypothetical protein
MLARAGALPHHDDGPIGLTMSPSDLRSRGRHCGFMGT